MKLADVCDAVVDCEHKTAPIDPTGKFFAVGTPAMRQNVIDYSQARRIGYETFRAWTRRLQPQYGDLLLAREAPVGPVVSIPREENVAPGQRTVLLRPNAAMCESRFLFYYLAMPSTQGRLNDLAAGSTVAHLNVADVRDFEVELPDLATQTAIADVLGALDDKITADEQVVTALDSLVRAMVEGGMQGETVRVGDVASLVSSKSNGGGPVVPYLGLEHLPRRRMWAQDSGLSSEVTSQKSVFEEGDLLFGKLRPYFHKVVVAQHAGVCSTDILVVRAISEELRGWMWAALASDDVVATVTASSTGTRMPRASWGDLAEVQVPWPGRSEAARVSREIESLNARAAAAVAESQRLAATRDALLPELMSGRLTIRTLEDSVR